MAYSKAPKKRLGINTRPILSLVIGLSLFSIVIIATMMSNTRAMNTKITRNNSHNSQEEVAAATGGQADKVLAVVKAIDTELKTVTLYDINKKELLELSYTSGTNITDKYDKAITINRIEVGEMVDIDYQKYKAKLTDMKISTRAWRYAKVSNLGIDRGENRMKIVSRLYKYDDDIFILNGEEAIPVTDLAEQDELTVRGYEDTIYSIVVTRGHGTVILENYDNFLGDYITIGYEAIQRITKDMEITVREGNFNLTVENGAYSATKNITVKRNETSYVSLSDLGPGGGRIGRITFQISPFGADLFVDGERLSYSDPLELDYGEHKLKVSMKGYTSYQGVLTVDAASKTVKVDLPEASSDQEATATESNTSSGNTGSSSGSGTGSGGNTSQGNSNQNGGQNGNQNGNQINNPGNSTEEDVDGNHLIYIQAPSGASVYLDGNYKCTAPGSFPKVIGTHVLTFIKEGYETTSYTVEVSDDGLDSYYTFPELAKKD
ncbi:MAG TPA: PEGA domain-containing protein [Clostridiales bacterium]|nr:PEGA domain-containing protein [Clostridiales bacterium]